ncbi:hypothetical protein DFJ74DRAFT_693925 [Hyaloraphidium curvatum]|nr:hypothetical protein DFJ74DRAFT_693925 [Hyaloraphidium curvatum]
MGHEAMNGGARDALVLVAVVLHLLRAVSGVVRAGHVALVGSRWRAKRLERRDAGFGHDVAVRKSQGARTERVRGAKRRTR